MNEMRYAGHHLLGALDDDGRIIEAAELIRATNHAKRACYEAGEAGILTALDQINTFKQDYKRTVVSSIIRNYGDIISDATHAQDRVKKERDHASPDGTDFEDFVVHFRKLRDHCRILDLSRDELNKLALNERKVAQRWLIGICIAAVGIVAASGFAMARLFLPS